ncbi:MAG: DNA repair protein RecN [Stappiaceae bacterium]
MLAALSIRDIVLIDRLDLDFSDGMSVLTGETGAGKSILLDSMTLALGGRGDAGLVRHGQPHGQIIAVFDVPIDHPSRLALRENDVNDEGDIILRRIQSADGRTRAYVNDQPVSASLLRQIGTSLVEIHGQHDERALIDPATHRDLLDAYGGLNKQVDAVSKAWRDVRTAERDLESQRNRIETARREADYLRSSVEELTRLAPQPGEEEDLAIRRQRMMQVEKVATDIADANESLNGSASPIPELSGILRRLERKADQSVDLLSAPIENLARALDYLEEARSGLDEALRATEFDPGSLEHAEERLFALRAAGRKFSIPVDDLPKLCAQMSQDLVDLDAGEEKLAALEAGVEKARGTYDQKAATLSDRRRQTAGKLEKVVAKELPDLKLERARFVIEFQSDPKKPSVDGIDQIEFWVQTNPGTRAGPMMKVASGGELSRFLLALKVALADRGSAPTLVFDEIDTGVGGAVAEAIGLRLSRLSNAVQVLTVTHAPQVAARAAGHFLISKEPVDKERVATKVMRIQDGARKEEIARMLAGAVITDEARAAAERLISDHAA